MKYGEPNAREMLFITDEANLASRQGKDDEPIDWDALTAKWDAMIGGESGRLARQPDRHPDARRSRPRADERYPSPPPTSAPDSEYGRTARGARNKIEIL